jgi:hypothetical protein
MISLNQLRINRSPHRRRDIAAVDRSEVICGLDAGGAGTPSNN